MGTLPRLALFDIDGTVFRSSLLIELVHALIKNKVFPQEAWHTIEPLHRAWQDRQGDYNDYLRELVRVYLHHHAGCREDEVLNTVRNVLDEQHLRTYRYTAGLINRFKRDDYRLIAISGSPEYIVREFAQKWHFDAAFGRVLEVYDGRFTNRMHNGQEFIIGNADLDKTRILREYLETHNLQSDLSACYAIGDTESDIPMLQSVGHPIAFNPDGPLLTVALARNWHIVVERKNIAYEFEKWKLLDTIEYPT